MEFIKETEGAALVVKLSGRLDTNTAKQFEQELFGECEKNGSIILDFAELQYLSSAGLRVLLAMQKKMSGKALSLRNVNKNVMEVFEITGFVDVLNII